ncbi:TPA: winged helix-turn-helix domain-containing protein [Stenotrophomonas maltophilia]|nr:winged helix-turn-helix domain-containing protein [Stenotrophomonas maltophilia]
MNRLLLVEDDDRLASLVVRYLQGHGFVLQRVCDGASALDAIAADPPDIVLLDLGLPDMDGLDLCRAIRPGYKGLLCILSARADDIHQVLGLELGADDYISKPVEPRLLVARLRAHLRRLRSGTEDGVLLFGQLRIDVASRDVMLGEAKVQLTTSEFDLLSVLAGSAGRILSRDQLFKHLRGIGFNGMDRSIDARISRLRRKLGDTDMEATCIKTVRGKGYLFSQSGWQ